MFLFKPSLVSMVSKLKFGPGFLEVGLVRVIEVVRVFEVIRVVEL